VLPRILLAGVHYVPRELHEHPVRKTQLFNINISGHERHRVLYGQLEFILGLRNSLWVTTGHFWSYLAQSSRQDEVDGECYEAYHKSVLQSRKPFALDKGFIDPVIKVYRVRN
jgi:hypothetical protein